MAALQDDAESLEMVSKHSEMEDMLVSAPESVALLAQLMIISSSTEDFKLEKPIKGRFEFIKDGSFRSSLVQVSNDGHSAFNEAHKSMGTIYAKSENIPSLVQQVVNILKSDDVDDLEMLPISLNQIDETAKTCADLAKKVEAKFEAVMDLTGEVMAAFTSTRGGYEGAAHRPPQPEAKPESRDKLLADLANANLADSKVIGDVLRTGIRALGDVRKQWRKLVEFFQQVSSIINDNFGTLVTQFTASATLATPAEQAEQKPSSNALKNALFTQAQSIYKVSFQVTMISSSYIYVSKKYLMTQVASLGELMALNPDTQKKEIQKLRDDINLKCQDATHEIKSNSEKRGKEALANFTARFAAISI